MLIGFFIGLITGVAFQLQQAMLWESQFYLGLFVAALSLIALLIVFSRRLKWRWMRCVLWWLLAAVLSFGVTGWRATQFMRTAMNPALEGPDIQVMGIIKNMPQQMTSDTDSGLRFLFDVESAHLNDQTVTLPPRLMISWYRRSFNDDVDATDFDNNAPSKDTIEDAIHTPHAGERWQFTLRLKAPHGNVNPYGFDYELWLWEQGAQATGYVRENGHEMPPKLLSVQWSPLYAMQRTRQSVRDTVFQRLSVTDNATGILSALITGDQNSIEKSNWDVFRATGVSHLMSISGLHITMFAWAAALLIGGLWRRSARLTPRLCLALPAKHAGLIGGLILATLYSWFSGWGIPSQRTIWMLATVTLLRLSGLRWPWYAIWLLAASLLLIVDPWAMLQPGFWLSFMAVALLFASESEEAKPRNFFIEIAHQQWVITLGLAPLTLLLFQQVSIVGVLANVVAVPVITFIVTPLAMFGVAFAPLWNVAAWCVNSLALFLQWLAALPFATYSAPAAPLGLSAFAVLGGLLLVLPLPLKKRMIAIGCAICLMLPALLWTPTRPMTGQFDVVAIDIGQGNSLLVRTSTHSLLFDTGPRFSRESDAGHRTVVPFLRSLNEHLDILILSHRDSDHTGGAKAVLEMQPNVRVLTSVVRLSERRMLGLPDAIEPCHAGQHWQWDGVDFEILHPQLETLELEKLPKPNAIACVLKITAIKGVSAPTSALLTADIEAPQEATLVRMQPDKLPSTVLLVPHHGSKTSSSPAFLDAVNPKIALVQAGYKNRYKHPRPEVMARYDERHIQTILETTCGAATWSSAKPNGVVCERDVAKRYWMHVILP